MKSEIAENAVNDEFLPKKIVDIVNTKSYVQLPFNSANHVLTNPNLSETGKLFYILITMYSITNDEGNFTETAGCIWEKRLNLKSAYIYQVQKSLEEEGYLSIKRNKTNFKNEINIISPILPESIFNKLNKTKLSDFSSTQEAMKDLNNSSLFIPMNLTLMTTLLKDKSIGSFVKVLWIYFFFEGYKHKTKKKLDILQVFKSQKEIAETFNVSPSKISRAIAILKNFGYIECENKRIRDRESKSNRRDKSIWDIRVSFPKSKLKLLESLNNRDGKNEVAKRSHSFHDRSEPLAITEDINNKNTIIKKLNNKNIPVCENNEPLIEKTVKPGVLEPNVFIEKENNESINAENVLESHVIEIDKLSKKIEVDDNLRISLAAKYSPEESQAINLFAQGLILKTLDSSDEELFELKNNGTPVEKLIINDFICRKSILFDIEQIDLMINENQKFQTAREKDNEIDEVLENVEGDENFAEVVYENDKIYLNAGDIKHTHAYVAKLVENNDVSLKYQTLSSKRIAMEVINFIRYWKPNKKFSSPKDERLFKLSVAGKMLKDGKWNTPQDYLIADRQQINFNLRKEREKYGIEEPEQNLSKWVVPFRNKGLEQTIHSSINSGAHRKCG